MRLSLPRLELPGATVVDNAPMIGDDLVLAATWQQNGVRCGWLAVMRDFCALDAKADAGGTFGGLFLVHDNLSPHLWPGAVGLFAVYGFQCNGF